MSQSAGAHGAPALVLRVSVPAGGNFRSVVKELAAKVAGYLGSSEREAAALSAVLDGLTSKVVPPGSPDQDKDITFEFRQAEQELLIEARCSGRSSEARHRLPA